MEKFIDREQELDTLESEYERKGILPDPDGRADLAARQHDPGALRYRSMLFSES
ncbi:MAG: hypothetical protein IJV40_05975 [Oscillospiraceae bacterium]|nr:hypothetical protein [Oscillospiraceae bacterium]